eukprot:Amastigsp_a510217_21.p3 type:complete len:108 gc:universal Amastigsp_a510217_21:1-324(+)
MGCCCAAPPSQDDGPLVRPRWCGPSSRQEPPRLRHRRRRRLAQRPCARRVTQGRLSGCPRPCTRSDPCARASRPGIRADACAAGEPRSPPLRRQHHVACAWHAGAWR